MDVQTEGGADQRRHSCSVDIEVSGSGSGSEKLFSSEERDDQKSIASSSEAKRSSAGPSVQSGDQEKREGHSPESISAESTSTRGRVPPDGPRGSSGGASSHEDGDEEAPSEEQRDDVGSEDQDGDDEERQEQGPSGRSSVSSGPSSPSWSGSEGSWDEEKWLQMADFYDSQRRPTTNAGIEARKLKYPELYRSDVTVCPSYSQFEVPYWSVCRRRYARSLRRISQQLSRGLEEMALLQTRALDGVRVARCFSQGARPARPMQDPLTERERRRVERLLTGS